MLQFARCTRWLLPLTLLLTAVIIQMCMPAEGGEAEEFRPAQTQVAELEDEEAEDEQPLPPVEVLETEEDEPVMKRWRKQMRRYYDRNRAVLLPLIIVGVAAVYAAAGLMVYRLQRPVRAKLSEFWHRQRRGRVEEEVPLNVLVETGKRIVPAAAALGIAVGAAALIYNRYGPSGPFGGPSTWGGVSPSEGPQ